MKKIYKKRIAFILLPVILFGCSASGETADKAITSKSTAASSNSDSTLTVDDDNNVPYEARLYYGETDVYSSVKLVKGDKINIPSKVGYDFKGYATNTDSAYYIDENGYVIHNYHGTETLDLYPVFSPQEYKITFYYNNEKLVLELSEKYDQDIREFLPLGKLIGNPSECITSLMNSVGETLVNADNDDPIYIKDLSSALDSASKELKLYVKTSKLSYSNQREDTYTVQKKDIIDQKLNASGTQYDSFDISESIDIAALKNLGYTKAVITLECSISPIEGNQRIVVLNNWPENKKELKNCTLIDTGTIKFKNSQRYYIPDTDDNEKNDIDNVIPIEKMGEKIYIGYSAENMWLKDASWNTEGLSITIEFQK